MTDKITAIELKKINRNRIYRLIYDKREISRQEIAAALSLSLPTVNQNLKELTAEGLIHYTGSFESTGGRKAQAITPVRDARITIGLDIRKTYIRILAVDLYGNVLDYEKYLKTFCGEEEYARNLGYLVDNMIMHNHFERENILGVGLAVPGVFDRDMEYIVKAPSLGIENFSLRKLDQFISCPVLIDNDANAGAFTELWNHLNEESVTYLLVEKGVGGCAIQRNGILKGNHNHAGEFGHMTLYPDGRRCDCGKRGCLEAYISTDRLSEDLDCQLEDFFLKLAAGNTKYKGIWEEYSTNLCIGLNNIYMMYDGDIILGGALTQYLEPYVNDIRKKLALLNSFEGSGDYLKLTKYQSRATAVGAALQLVSAFMESV